MTLDELTVKITVSAEEALAALDTLSRRIQEIAAMLEEKKTLQLDTAQAETDAARLQKAVESVGESAAKQSDAVLSQLGKIGSGDGVEGMNQLAKRLVTENQEALDQVSASLKSYDGLYENQFRTMVDRGLEAIESGDGGQALAKALKAVFSMDLSRFDLDENPEEAGAVAADYVMGLVDLVMEAVQNADLSEATETLQTMMAQLQQGIQPDEDAVEGFTEAWETLLGEESPLVTFINALAEQTGELAPAITEQLMGLLTGVEELAGITEAFGDSAQQWGESLTSMSEEAQGASDSLTDYSRSVDELERNVQTLDRRVGNVTTVKKNIDAYKDARKAYDNARKSGKDLDDAFGKMQRSAKTLGVQMDKGTGSVKDMDKAVGKADDAVASAERGIAAEGAGIVSTLQGMLLQAQRTEDALNVQATMGVDVSQPLAAIRAVIGIISKLLSLMGAAGIKPKSGGGGGGGGGRSKGDDDGGYDSSEADAEEAARKAEEARKEAIQRDYDYAEHRRHMNEITLEEELALIEKIRTAHQLNAEEIMEWEEKIYDLKQEIRERDAESIDTLADGVLEALENRYEAMRDAELDRLDASREAWEQWRDDSVDAINAQIDALEKLSDTEDREAKDAEELRKIEKLRREAEYEQDEYNRAKLRQQLDDAVGEREERLRKLALQDQKDALRAEIEKINDQADGEIDALDKQEESVEAAYAERLKEANLQAEAEKLLMTRSQDEIMNLLYQYVPEYDALGKSMGEKLLEGFQSKVGNIVNWFKDFNAGITQMQQQLAQTSNAALEGFYAGYSQRQESGAAGVVVNQSVVFNEPVESPSQVARRMEDVNDALGQMLA